MTHFNPEECKSRFMNSFVIDEETGCWNWNKNCFNNRYGRFWIKHQGRLAHRVSWEMFHGEIPTDLCVCHKCDNMKCVNPDHLFLGTVIENVQDRVKKDRTSKGPTSGRHTHPEKSARGEKLSKLTPDQVLFIRETWAERKMSQCEMARQLGVHYDTIWNIVHRRCWKHI